jgi:hypothetical protein
MVTHSKPYRELTAEEKRRVICRAAANVHQGRGKLVPEACMWCGTTVNVEKHHDDYSDPKAVQWICAPHHRMLHQFTKSPRRR